MQIKDKRALVTGAAGGLGQAFTRELLRNGATKVIMVDVLEPEGELAAAKFNEDFGPDKVEFISCDITRSSEFDGIFKRVVREMGGLDILINNAGVVNEVDFMKAIDVNITAVIRGTLLGIQQMGKDSGGRGGVIVNVASILGLEALPQLPVYSTTKNAVISFSRSFSQPYHYQRTGVRIIVLCPGLTTTPMLSDLTNPSYVKNIEDLCVAIENIPPQRAENVAHGLVYAIRCAQNGSIWVSEDGKPIYEIQLPDAQPEKVREYEVSSR